VDKVAKQNRDEPEILEGLARDIVSRLTTTLFGDEEPPPAERARPFPDDALSLSEGAQGAGPGARPLREDARPAPEDGRLVPESGRRIAGAKPHRGPQAREPYETAAPPVPGRRASPTRRVKGQAERPALLVRGTVRSGRQIRHNGAIVVLGDVNPGAQLVAAGDVVVVGVLRGMVHAGATGDYRAVVAAFRLAPVQLRIASYLARPPEEPGGHPEYPEVALVRDGIVVVRPLAPGVLPGRRPASLV